MPHLNIISQNPESTLVSEFKRDDKRERSYQSEAALEATFIRQLQEQGYELVRVDDLLSRNGAKLKMGVPYRSCKFERGAVAF